MIIIFFILLLCFCLSPKSVAAGNQTGPCVWNISSEKEPGIFIKGPPYYYFRNTAQGDPKNTLRIEVSVPKPNYSYTMGWDCKDSGQLFGCGGGYASYTSSPNKIFSADWKITGTALSTKHIDIGIDDPSYTNNKTVCTLQIMQSEWGNTAFPTPTPNETPVPIKEPCVFSMDPIPYNNSSQELNMTINYVYPTPTGNVMMSCGSVPNVRPNDPCSIEIFDYRTNTLIYKFTSENNTSVKPTSSPYQMNLNLKSGWEAGNYIARANFGWRNLLYTPGNNSSFGYNTPCQDVAFNIPNGLLPPPPTPTPDPVCQTKTCRTDNWTLRCDVLKCDYACVGCPNYGKEKPFLANLNPICDNIYDKENTNKNLYDACKDCLKEEEDPITGAYILTSKRLWTAIGCVPMDIPTLIKEYILTYGIGIAGAISFLYFLYGCFLVLTSAGNPERVEAAKQIITSAISGLLLIIFSVFLLHVIGVDILRLPGFE